MRALLVRALLARPPGRPPGPSLLVLSLLLRPLLRTLEPLLRLEVGGSCGVEVLGERLERRCKERLRLLVRLPSAQGTLHANARQPQRAREGSTQRVVW